jgi:hypothetical protein
MTGITRAELDRRLTRHLVEEVEQLMATTDIQRQQEELASRLQHARRQRTPIYLAVAGAAAVAVVVAVAVLVASRSTSGHRAAPATSLLPQPAASPLTVYRGGGSRPGSTEQVISFLDVQGRWCTATLDSAAPPVAADYSCRASKLAPQTQPFGAVYGVGDAPSYDNFRSWFGGVASHDVTRVTVVFGDGSVVAAKVLDQGSANGVVFSLAWPTTTSNPAYYRAYAADGHLIGQIPVQQAVIPK